MTVYGLNYRKHLREKHFMNDNCKKLLAATQRIPMLDTDV
jgi:hypothetical protein